MRRRRLPVSGVSHEVDCKEESGSGDAFRLRLLENIAYSIAAACDVTHFDEDDSHDRCSDCGNEPFSDPETQKIHHFTSIRTQDTSCKLI